MANTGLSFLQGLETGQSLTQVWNPSVSALTEVQLVCPYSGLYLQPCPRCGILKCSECPKCCLSEHGTASDQEEEPGEHLRVGATFTVASGSYENRAIAIVLARNSTATLHMVGARGALYHVELCVFPSSREMPIATANTMHRSIHDCHVVRVSYAQMSNRLNTASHSSS